MTEFLNPMHLLILTLREVNFLDYSPNSQFHDIYEAYDDFKEDQAGC